MANHTISPGAVRALLLALVLSSGIQCLAQSPATFGDLHAKYPHENIVFPEDRTELIIRPGSGGLEMVRHNFTSTYYLTDRAHEYAERSVGYASSFEEIQNLEAKAYLPSGSSFKVQKVKAFTKESATSRDVFYDDRQMIKFSFPGLEKGALTTVSYDEKINDPHFLGSFFFKRYAPVEKAVLSVEFPESVRLKYILKGDTTGITFRQEKKGRTYIYTWEGRNLQKLVSESSAPDMRYFAPHILVYVESYTIGRQNHTVFKDVATLYNWYYGFLKKGESEDNAYVHKVTDSIIKGTGTDLEKTKRIFYWVQGHIKYIAFEYGYGGFIPRDANWVCSRRFGDCKDMANILVTMLRRAGVKAHHVWIGTRDIPYTYAGVPLPAVDNHMIAVAYVDGKEIFLDATGGFLPLGLPTPMIQGKEALISLDSANFKIEKVPVVASARNLGLDTTYLRFQDGTLHGNSRTVLSGFTKYSLYWKYYSYGQAKRQEELTKSFIRGNNKCKVTDLTYRGFDDRDSDLTVSCNFTLPDYVTQREDELYINLALDKHHQDGVIDTADRKLDIEAEYKHQFGSVTSFEIPKGYVLHRLPANSSLKKDGFSFAITYEVKENKVVFKQEVVHDYLLMPKSGFTAWNELVGELRNAYRETVVLKKIKS